ncbi:phosphatase PAP2 family protein [Elioraea rosea]|uniref:phosphatase PAP2 family protein n=1 Tax=Elioraea rosea TaxID=2492390 RepID=UPI0013155C62|nr:phosphatase PAP2 family protein [Elioraea rosea]
MLRTKALSILIAASVVAPVLAQPVSPSAMPTLLIAAPSAIAVPPPPDAAATARELDALRRQALEQVPDLALRLRQWEAGGPAYRWNAVAVSDQVDRFVRSNQAARTLALVHAAIHDATVIVQAARARHQRPSPASLDPSLALPGARAVPFSYPSEAAATGEAASIILAALIPDRADAYKAMARHSVALRQQAGLEFASDAEAGRSIGAAIAAVALERARADGFDARWTGSVPTGPGFWHGANPAFPMAGTWRPWVLPANDALRPPPPPAFDSAATRAAIAELKAWPRSPKANHDAIYWDVFGGNRIFQFWNAELSRLVLEYDLAADPVRTAAAFTAVNIALHDGGVACWDAKYAYWYLRPSQLDPEVRTLFPNAPHPSYPSAHSCFSSAAGLVLARLFPAEEARFATLIEQAGVARLVAGLHYRFDIEAANTIGRGVAELVIGKLGPALR